MPNVLLLKYSCSVLRTALSVSERSQKKKPSCRQDSRPYCLTAPFGSRDIIGHVTIRYPYAISYWWSFGTESVSPAVFEMLHFKHIGIKSLTSQGRVTSSVTWPYDTPICHFLLWSFGTKLLSLTVSEIFNIECNAMVDMTLIRPLNKGQGH